MYVPYIIGLQCLLRICTDLRLKDAHDYAVKLKSLSRDHELTSMDNGDNYSAPSKASKTKLSLSNGKNGSSFTPSAYLELEEASYKVTGMPLLSEKVYLPRGTN